jgi:hypothetical protein
LISSGKLELLRSIEIKENFRKVISHLEIMLDKEEIQAYFMDNLHNLNLDLCVERISIASTLFISGIPNPNYL